MSAKNKKKTKGKTVALSDFLHDDKDLAPGFKVTHVDWADAIENEDSFDRHVGDKKVVLPTAPKSSREPVVDLDQVPNKPPFTAYVGNLPYDITEEDIERFFRKMKLDVTSVRIPREGGDRGRIRGFGYAEFPDRMSLIEALSLNSETLKNRSIKVSLATEHGNDNGERKEERSDRTAGDWRSSSRQDSMGGRSDRNFTPDSGYGAEPYRGRSSNEYDSNRDDRERRYGDRDRGFGGDRDRGFGGDRDRGFGGDRDRGFGGDRDRGFGGDRDRGFGGDRDRGFGGDRDRGFGGDRDRGFRDRGGFERRDQGRNYGGSRSDDFRRGDDYSRRGGDDFQRRGNPSDNDGPKERPKLQLKPRSVPVEGAESADSASSKIFGGAKPVDTAARERQIEEKLSKDVVEPKPSGGGGGGSSNIFGGAKPVDTAARERQIEEKMSKEENGPKSVPDRNRDDNKSRRPGGVKSQESHNNYKNSLSNDNSAPDRPPRPLPVEKEEPVVYTSANKFSHLLNDEDYAADESSD